MEKLLLVTGASRGIGAEVAKLAAIHGYLVCINYLSNDEAAAETLNAIQSAGGKAFLSKGDVSQESYVKQLFAELDMLGQLNALVNNVGILKAQTDLLGLTADRINRILSVNVTSQFLVSREAVRRMSTEKGGRGGAIVNISSLASKTGSPNEYLDYAASKGAVDSFTIGLAKEVAKQGIRVNGVRPAFINTEIHADGGEPERLKRVESLIPMGRIGEVKDVAETVLWLLSDKANFVTGSFIDVAGGY